MTHGVLPRVFHFPKIPSPFVIEGNVVRGVREMGLELRQSDLTNVIGKDFSKYVSYFHNQVRELLDGRYGKVDILWYDFTAQKPSDPWWDTFKHTDDWKGVELMVPLNVSGFPRKDVDPSFILPVVKPDVEIPVIEVYLKKP